MSLTALAIVLVLNLKVFPILEETLSEISPTQADATKSRLFNLTIGLLIFIFLGNFYFWKLDSKLEKEEKEAESALKINPNDPVLKERLIKISNKRKYCITLIEPIFMIVLGALISFIVISILRPLYTFLGTF